MNIHNIILFVEESLIAHLGHDAKNKDWPITLKINKSNKSHNYPKVDIYFKDKESLKAFKDSINQEFDKHFNQESI